MRTTSGPGLPSGFPFSLAAAANGFCFISGMPALGADGTYTAGTFTSEADLAWRNVTNIAEAAGYSARDIVFVQCVLADIGHYGEFNDWWRRRFADPSVAPARFTFQAGALPFGAKIELQAVAHRGR
ncbi:RidA family protein [Nonomuraea sp. NPDC059023]|uniref:RidA family protein n=1 Tax=unclassified Nonomuraea TaxID=2593643 RepID=UPI0036824623